MRGAWFVLVCAAGCGRVGFERRDAGPIEVADAIVDVVISTIGCSDGEREAFTAPTFVDIAGCAAGWPGTPSMRDPRTSGACGDDLVVCAVPADACADGWHLCGVSGDPSDLSNRITGAQCANPGGVAGRFVAALGHCASCLNACTGGEPDCVYGGIYECSSSFISCSEPVCCGSMCTNAGNCHGGVFPAPDTHIGFAGRQCGALRFDGQTGVLCCRD